MVVLPGGGSVMVHTIQDDVTGCPAECLPLPHRLLVDLTIHHYHHQARDPKGNTRTNDCVRSVHDKGTHLKQQTPFLLLSILI